MRCCSALGYMQDYHWADEFKEGREYTQHTPHSERPRSSSTAENSVNVEKLIMGDRRLSGTELAETLGIAEGNVYLIVTDS